MTLGTTSKLSYSTPEWATQKFAMDRLGLAMDRGLALAANCAGVPGHCVSAMIGRKDCGRPPVRDIHFHELTLADLKPAIESLALPIDVDRLAKAREGRTRWEPR